jgi:hypothetical protein
VTTRELIERLRALDPDGTMPVINYDSGDEYLVGEVAVAAMRLYTDGHYYDWRAGEKFGEKIDVVAL